MFFLQVAGKSSEKHVILVKSDEFDCSSTLAIYENYFKVLSCLKETNNVLNNFKVHNHFCYCQDAMGAFKLFHFEKNGKISKFQLCQASIAQSVEHLPAWSHILSGSMIDSGFEPHQCLLTGT